MADDQILKTIYEIDLQSGDSLDQLARLNGAIDELKRNLRELEATEGKGTRAYAEQSRELNTLIGMQRRMQSETQGLTASQLRSIRSLADQARGINANEAAARSWINAAKQQVQVQQQVTQSVQQGAKAAQDAAVYQKTYVNGFTPLAFEVQQIARELPNLSQGLPIFFRSLSNNLPMLQDRLRGARRELEALNAQGIKGVPIWKQIVSTIFSWQTALIAIITLVTAFGDEIAGFTKSLFGANTALERFKDTTREAFKNAQEELVTLDLLTNAAADNARSTDERTSAALELQELYPTIFGNLTTEQIMLGDVATANEDARKQILLAAEAEAYRAKIVENSMKILDLQRKLENTRWREFWNVVDAGTGIFTKLGLTTEGVANSIDKLTKENELYADSINLLGLTEGNLEEQREREERKRKEREAAARAARNKTAQEQREAYKEAQLLLDLQNEIAIAELKATRMNYSSNISERIKFEAELFRLQQKGYTDRLNLQLEYEQIAANEYAQRLRLHEIASASFENEQAERLSKFVEELHSRVLKSAQADTDELIAATEKKYAQAIADLNSAVGLAPVKLPEMTDDEFAVALTAWEEMVLKAAQIEIALEKQKQEDIAEIRENALKAQLERIDKAMSTEYGDDLARYADNEREKLRITEEMLQEQIALYREAGASTWKMEAELNANRRKQAKLDLELALNTSVKNATDRYNIQKAAIQRELELTAGNVDEQAKLQKQLVDLTTAYQKERADALVEFMESATQLASELMNVFKAADEQRLYDLEERFNQEKQLLADKYATGLLTEAQYNAQLIKLENKLDKERRKLERDAAKREKAIAIAEILTNTARAIMETMAQTGFFGIPLTAIVAALGAAQLAAVVAQSLPRAADGMYVKGASHSQGGVPIEAEGGEVIINKRSAAAFLPQLSAINVAGGGVPFTSGISDGGFAVRQMTNNSLDSAKAEITEAVIAGVKATKIFVAVDDYRRADEKYARAVSAGTIS